MLDCPSCSNQFDSNGRLPKLLPKCGHTICLECVSKLLNSIKIECSECQTSYFAFIRDKEAFQTNFALQRVVEAMRNVCEKHRAPKDQVCLEDYQTICINCVNYDDHYKGKSTKSLIEIQTQAKNKIQEINHKEAAFNQEKSELEGMTENSFDSLVKNSFDQLKADDARKKRHLQWDIEAMFVMKQRLTEVANLEATVFKEKIARTCETLESHNLTDDYLEIVGREIVYPTQVRQEQPKDLAQKLEENVKKEMENFSSEQKSVLEQDFFKDLCERSDSQNFKMVLETAQRKYFEMNLDDQQTLTIIPKSINQTTSTTAEQISIIKKLNFKHHNVKYTQEMTSLLTKIWNNLSPDVEVRMTFHEKHFKDTDLISCSKLPFWESPSLNALQIDFTRCSFEEVTALPDFLAATLKNPLSLKSFALFLESTNIISSTIASLSTGVLPLMKNLEELILWLDNTKITDKSLKCLLQKREKLKILKLSLRGTNISYDAGFILADQILRNLPNLQELLLYLRESKIPSAGIDYLLKNLASLTNLETLKLSLVELQITDRNVQSLAYYLSESAGNLKQLYLDLDQNEISEISLGALCSSLPKQISSLIFTLQGVCVTDKNVKTLVTESLKKMPNLTILNLSLAETQTTQESVFDLCSFFENNDKLTELKLDFRATAANDDALSHFINKIVPTLSALKTCFIDVSFVKLEKSTLDLVENLNKKYE